MLRDYGVVLGEPDPVASADLRRVLDAGLQVAKEELAWEGWVFQSAWPGVTSSGRCRRLLQVLADMTAQTATRYHRFPLAAVEGECLGPVRASEVVVGVQRGYPCSQILQRQQADHGHEVPLVTLHLYSREKLLRTL